MRRPAASTLVLPLLLAGAVAACGSPAATPAGGPPADLVLRGGDVWTGRADAPLASAVAVRGHRIVAVGSEADVDPLVGAGTRVVELDGRFVAPGFIDNHTHFGRAGSLLLGVNLLDVNSEAGLVRAVREARDRLPDGAWITGGDWGAYAQWARGSAGEEAGGADGDDGAAAPGAAGDGAAAGDDGDSPGEGGAAAGRPFRPRRAVLDSVTPETPVVLSRWDGERWLANGRALEVAGADCTWAGVDCEDGRPTGRLSPEAAERLLEHRPETSMERRLAEADTALDRLLASGVTTFHDVTPPRQLAVFQELGRRGDLRVRVLARPTLDRWDELRAAGLEQGFGDRWLKIGTLKGFVDGIMGNSSARFYEPYRTTGERGSWRDMVTEPPGMERLMAGADSSGFWMGIHAIGDQAVDTLLTMYERTLDRNGPPDAEGSGGPDERRHRVIHAQVLRDGSVAERIAELGLVAEMQPYHAIDDMRWMEERIGPERSRWAYAFRTLREAGVRLSFGSDWPGTNAAWYPSSPLLGMYAAVARKTLTGEPEGGWYPGERVDVETALRAYTVHNAWAEGAEDEKGTIEEGKLADLVVLDRSPLEVPADSLKHLKVLATVVDGEVAFEAPPDEAREALHWAEKPGLDETSDEGTDETSDEPRGGGR